MVNDWKMPMTVTEEDKIRMTVVLIKLLVCPRLRDDHSGRSIGKSTQTSNFIAAESRQWRPRPKAAKRKQR